MLTKQEKKQIRRTDRFYWFVTIFLGCLSFFCMHLIPDWQLYTLWALWVLMTIIYVLYMKVMFRRFQIRKQWKEQRQRKRMRLNSIG